MCERGKKSRKLQKDEIKYCSVHRQIIAAIGQPTKKILTHVEGFRTQNTWVSIVTNNAIYSNFRGNHFPYLSMKIFTCYVSSLTAHRDIIFPQIHWQCFTQMCLFGKWWTSWFVVKTIQHFPLCPLSIMPIKSNISLLCAPRCLLWQTSHSKRPLKAIAEV